MKRRSKLWRRVGAVVGCVLFIDLVIYTTVLGSVRNDIATAHHEGRAELLEQSGALEVCDQDPGAFSIPDVGAGLLVPIQADGRPFNPSIILQDLGEAAHAARPGIPARVETPGPVWSAVVVLDRDGPCNRFWMTPPQPLGRRPLLMMFLSRIVFALGMTLALVLLIVRPLTRRISRLSEQATRLAEDNFVGKVTVQSDEFGAIGTVVNLAARRARDLIAVESEQRELLHDLFADLSHDIRTPLASMKLSIDALSSGDDSVAISRSMRAELEYLDAMFANLATIARLRSAILPIKTRPTVMQVVVDRVCERFSSLAMDKGVEVVPAYPLVDVTAVIDPLTVEQAIGNVVHNAIKFADEHVAIVVALTTDAVSVKVMDDGPGVHEADRAQLMNRSFRGTNGGARSGLGLGLSIASQIVQRHSGTIELAPHSLGGTDVTITLPLQQPDEV
jgi:signal transduction histidine kinase